MINWSIFFKGVILLLFLSLSVRTITAQENVPEKVAVSSHVLDGRTYFGQNGSKGKSADHDDEFIFKDGMFRSTSCDKYGFVEGRYETTDTDGVISFRSVTESPSHGQMAWEGTVDGDSLEGTFVWTKERWYWNIRKEYWFKGKLNQ